MPEEYVPPVVAVVVVTGPVGPSLETCLESLASQDYPMLDVLVVDTSAGQDVTTRVAGVLPGAFVRRRQAGESFPAAANEVLAGVEGASFFLFCSPDMALAPDAVRLLVQEAFRSNAAVVGPKLVDWEDPDRLVALGVGMDRFGAPVTRIEEGELDQSQHDEVREVFAVPAAGLLARVDLFAAVGGFDEAMGAGGEDVDLCWRARLAGARVVVVPVARACLRRPDRPARKRRESLVDARSAQLRSVLKNYGWLRRCGTVCLLGLLTVAGTLTAPLTGSSDLARARRGAFRRNIADRRSISAARRLVHETRQVRDGIVVAQMTHRAHIRRAARTHFTSGQRAGDTAASLTEAGPRSRTAGHHAETGWLTDWLVRLQHGELATGQLIAGIGIALLVLLGVRGVLFGPLPLVGQLLPGPAGVHMLGSYFGGTTDPGWRANQVASPAYGVVGILATVLGNSSALALKVIFLGALALGALGSSRLVRDFGSPRAGIVAAAAFLVNPLVWNGLARGDLGSSVALAGLPFVLRRLAKSSRLRPFAPAHGAGKGASFAAFVAEAAPLGLLLAVMVALAPAVVVDFGVVVVGTTLASVVVGGLAGMLRSLLVALGALVVAFACCLPWSVTWFQPGVESSLITGPPPPSGTALGPADLLRGFTGPVGHWWGAFGLVAAAGFVILWARRERFDWAVRWWTCGLVAIAVAWVGGEGWLGAGFGETAVLVAPLAVVVAACCGLGVAAFQLDVRQQNFGWRQATGVLACACFAVGALPVLGALPAGRAGLAGAGFDQASSELLAPAPHGFRVLWLGDPRSLPGSSWQLSPGLAGFVTPSSLPSLSAVWPTLNPGPAVAVGSYVKAAESRRTLQLGALLAPYGIRDLVVPTADAPVVPGVQSATPAVLPRGLVTALEAQTDMRQLPEEDGVLVFANAAWSTADGSGRIAALSPAPPASPSSPSSLSEASDAGIAFALLVVAAVVTEGFWLRRRTRRARRKVPSSGGAPGSDDGPPAASGPGEGTGPGQTSGDGSEAAPPEAQAADSQTADSTGNGKAEGGIPTHPRERHPLVEPPAPIGGGAR